MSQLSRERSLANAQRPAARLAYRQPIRRGYASEPSAGSALQGQGLVLGALALIAGGGYYYLKPVRDVAARLNSMVETVQETGEQAVKKAKVAASAAADTAKQGAEAVGIDSADSLDGIAKAVLPAGAFAVWSQVKNVDVGGLISNLKDTDLQGALDSLKKVGGKDVKNIVTAIQEKLDAAGGQAAKVDWKALATDLNKKYGGEYSKYIDMLVGKVPNADDFNKYFEEAKKIGKDNLKQLDDAANQVYKHVEKAVKEDKNVGEAFVTGVKEATPEDVEKLITQLKSTAKEAGLPADWIENYLRKKAVDSIDSAEAWAREIEDKVRMVAKWLPVEQEDVVKNVSAVSPALAKIVDQLLTEVKQDGDKAGKAVEKGAEKAKDAIKK